MVSPEYERGLSQLVPRFKATCPLCSQRAPVGFLGGQTIKRFYCCDCGIEFVTKNDITQDTFLISEEGTIEMVPCKGELK